MNRSLVRHILRGIFGRRTVRSGVDAEHREVTRMPGPHPVIGIPSELADRTGRSPHQAHIPIHLLHKEQILVSSKKILDLDLLTLPIELRLALDLLHGSKYTLGPALLTHRIVQLRKNPIRYIFDPPDKSYGQSGSRNLLLVGHRPETILQVVVLYTAVLLNRPIPAVVVGQHQSALGDHTRRTSASENHNGILQGRTVGPIDILRRKFQPLGLHILDIQLLQIGQQPHSLVGPCRYHRETQNR